MYTFKLPTTSDLHALDEWHGGRTAFGLWYLQVGDLERFCADYRACFADVLAPDYKRQFHITVFVVGFYGVDDFSDGDLALQIKALQKLQLSPFYLTTSSLGTFDNSLHIAISPSLVLDDIRASLSATHLEISPARYVPHITLGFYDDNYPMDGILTRIKNVPMTPQRFLVDSLCFGTYVPTEPQGKLTCRYKLRLDNI